MIDDLAFPQYEVNMYGVSQFHGGMLLRDYLAAKAMQGLIADSHTMWDSQKFQGDHHTIAEWAYIMADAMLKKRSRCKS